MTSLAINPYGYGQAPGQNGYGYYEQQTPGGSFAAANQQYARGADPAQQQYASNPYIGQQAQGVGGAQSVMPWAQQMAGFATQANPFLGQQTRQAQQTGANAYGGGNPFLGQAIDAASQDAIRNYNTSIRPQLDSMGRASGSFGNTAIQELQQNAMGDLGRNLGNIASGMRMQDYTQQQALAENSLNRQQQVNLANAGFNAGDLSRNMSGFYQGQGLGLQGLAGQLGAAQFDANLGQQGGMFNAGQLNQMGQFNANQAQGLSQFNAGQGNAMNQFNANLGQQNGQFNAGQGNAMNQFNAGQGNQTLENFRNRHQRAGEFDQNMDFQTWQANNNNMRLGQRDQMDFMNTLMGWQQGGVNNATNVQNTPMNYWQQFVNGGAQLGGMGGSNSQQLYGNPFLGAIGGAMTGMNLYNSWGR